MEQVSPTNLFDKARALRAIVWKKSVQGLDVCVIAKGSYEETGRWHFMAAISYGKWVTAAEQYFGKNNADTFSSFVCEYFATMIKKYPNPKGKLFLQDRDQTQNSCRTRSDWDKKGHESFLFQHIVLI